MSWAHEWWLRAPFGVACVQCLALRTASSQISFFLRYESGNVFPGLRTRGTIPRGHRGCAEVAPLLARQTAIHAHLALEAPEKWGSTILSPFAQRASAIRELVTRYADCFVFVWFV